MNRPRVPSILESPARARLPTISESPARISQRSSSVPSLVPPLSPGGGGGSPLPTENLFPDIPLPDPSGFVDPPGFRGEEEKEKEQDHGILSGQFQVNWRGGAGGGGVREQKRTARVLGAVRSNPRTCRKVMEALGNKFLLTFFSFVSSFHPKWSFYLLWDIDFTLDDQRAAERKRKADQIYNSRTLLEHADDWATDWFMASLHSVLVCFHSMRAGGSLPFYNMLTDDLQRASLREAVVGALVSTQKASELRNLPREHLQWQMSSYITGMENLHDQDRVARGLIDSGYEDHLEDNESSSDSEGSFSSSIWSERL